MKYAHQPQIKQTWPTFNATNWAIEHLNSIEQGEFIIESIKVLSQIFLLVQIECIFVNQIIRYDGNSKVAKKFGIKI